MTTNNPMMGLFTLTMYRTRGAILTGLGGALVVGLSFLATEQEILYNMFVIFCMIHLPVQVLGGMGGNEGRWERFQVSMPIKRSDLLRLQFFSVVIVSIVGAIVLTTFIGITTHIHSEWFNYGFASAIASSLHSYGVAFLAIGLAFILGLFLPHNITGIIAFLAPAFLQALVPAIEGWTNVSVYIISATILVVSVVIFVVSYFVTKVAYERADF